MRFARSLLSRHRCLRVYLLQLCTHLGTLLVVGIATRNARACVYEPAQRSSCLP